MEHLDQLGLFIIYALIGMLIVSALSEWWQSRFVYVEEYCLFPDFKFIGCFIRDYGPKGLVKIVIIKLPSYRWERSLVRDTLCWHQAFIRWDQIYGLRLMWDDV